MTERLAQAMERIPAEYGRPVMGPLTTGLGEGDRARGRVVRDGADGGGVRQVRRAPGACVRRCSGAADGVSRSAPDPE